jgi:hypothetical protein
MKRDLTFAVDPSLYPHIHGTTDSEVIFHLALTLGLQDDPIGGITRAVQMVESVGREHGIRFPMQGTLATTDGGTGNGDGRGGGDVELLLEGLHELGELDEGHLLELGEEVVLRELRHDGRSFH